MRSFDIATVDKKSTIFPNGRIRKALRVGELKKN